MSASFAASWSRCNRGLCGAILTVSSYCYLRSTASWARVARTRRSYLYTWYSPNLLWSALTSACGQALRTPHSGSIPRPWCKNSRP